MNIVTKSDKKKFIALLKSGLKQGRREEMTIYSNATAHQGTDVVKEYYVALEYRFIVDPEEVDKLKFDDLTDNQIEELLG